MVAIPEGYRQLKDGDIIKPADKFYAHAAKKWQPVPIETHGKEYHSITYVEIIRKAVA